LLSAFTLSVLLLLSDFSLEPPSSLLLEEDFIPEGERWSVA
jgi:hypothetical protein